MKKDIIAKTYLKNVLSYDNSLNRIFIEFLI